MSGISFLQGSFRYRKGPGLVYYNETDDLLSHGQTTLLCHLPSRLLASMGFSLFSRSRESSAVKQVFLFPRTSVKQSYNLHRSNRRMRSQDPDRSLCPEFPSFPVHKNRSFLYTYQKAADTLLSRSVHIRGEDAAIMPNPFWF